VGVETAYNFKTIRRRSDEAQRVSLIAFMILMGSADVLTSPGDDDPEPEFTKA